MTKLIDCYGDVGPGWAALLTMLHAELMRFAPHYEALQVKEKFGGLRAYITTPQGEGIDPVANANRREAQALEIKYEALSLAVCEYCGRQGENKPGPTGEHGWFKTLCQEHRQKWADEGPMWRWDE